jgi:hypothetical protein
MNELMNPETGIKTITVEVPVKSAVNAANAASSAQASLEDPTVC